jgi:hypothetical protein
LGGPSGGPGYLNINAFGSAPVAPYAADGSTLYGNSGVGTILGPGQFNFDISLMKPFKIAEHHNVLLRADFFNAFNHPQFANPGGTSAAPSVCKRRYQYIQHLRTDHGNLSQSAHYAVRPEVQVLILELGGADGFACPFSDPVRQNSVKSPCPKLERAIAFPPKLI